MLFTDMAKRAQMSELLGRLGELNEPPCLDHLDIQKRLESLKHLGGEYTLIGKGKCSYSCDVTVHNYTSMTNWTSHTWNTTVSWTTGDGNLESALKWKLGSASKWSIMYTGAAGQKYNSFMYLQANVEDDLKNYQTRDDVRVHIYF
jgi:hypothetical protein